jgi:hypothetical protein
MGGGMKLQWNRYNRYLNNILVNSANVQIHGAWAGSQHYVARNIYVTNQPYGIGFYNNTTVLGVADSVKLNTKMIDSNCMWANGSSINPPSTDKGGSIPWNEWNSRGMDAHSVTADPMFTNTSKVWPNYVGDYSVKSGSPALGLGFRNFPMDSFGVMPIPYDVGFRARSPKTADAPACNFCQVFCKDGRIIVEHGGEFGVKVTNSLGRTMKTFSGKDHASSAFPAKSWSAGIYFAVIRTEKEMETRRFMIH